MMLTPTGFALLLFLLPSLTACSSSLDVALLATHSLTNAATKAPICTAVAIGHHLLLTATHCVDKGTSALGLDGHNTSLEVLAIDQHDHALVWSQAYLPHVATIGPAPRQGDEVFTLGHAAEVKQPLYRKGYMAGRGNMFGEEYWLFDIEGYKGDSGGGVFNTKGELVATTSQILTSNDNKFRMMGSFSYSFSVEQVEAAGVGNGKTRLCEGTAGGKPSAPKGSGETKQGATPAHGGGESKEGGRQGGEPQETPE